MELIKKNKNVVLQKCLLIIAVAYQVFYNSSFRVVNTSNIWKILGYISLVILLIYCVFKVISSSSSVYTWILFFIFLSIAAAYFYFGKFAVAMILVFTLYIFFMKSEDILSSYLSGIYLGTAGAIILSLIQVLPIKDSFGTLVLGFKNPNTTGYYFAMIAMIQIMIRKGNYKFWSFIVYLIAIFFNIKFFGNETAIMMMLLFILIYLVFSYVRILDRNWLITCCLGILPFVLFFIALYLGINYGKYSYIEKINRIVTSRPVIWHYYLTNYPLNLFGNNVQIYTNGLAFTIGQGAFDGAYIYFPILNGIFPFIVTLFGLSVSNIYLYRSRNFVLLTLFIVLEISGFSENLLYSFYQSPVIVMSLAMISKTWRKRNLV